MGCEIVVFAGKRVLVVGGGVTGSAVRRGLESLGAICTTVDERKIDGKDFISLDVAREKSWDFAVVSPGWRQNHPFIEDLRVAGVALVSEIDLAWTIKLKLNPQQKWIAVTGTNGKTTTVEMVTAMLKRAGKSVTACGNLGDAVIDAVLDKNNFEVLVVELSSFQLQWSDLPQFSASAILNIADDHSDWHGSFENYVKAKLRILDRTEMAVLSADDAVVVESTQVWQGRKIFFTLGSPRGGEIGVVEDLLVDRAFVSDPNEAEVLAELSEIVPFAPHSVLNSLAAAALALSAGADHASIRAAIRDFRPGRHRIETVLDSGDVKWINDSKATNPHAALASVSAFHSIIWIAGGLAKGAKMDDLIIRGGNRIRTAILIGHDRDIIAQALSKFAPEVPVMLVDSPTDESSSLMERVVTKANQISRKGDTILLAPACASMDQFVSYADRGDQFRDAVLKIAGAR